MDEENYRLVEKRTFLELISLSREKNLRVHNADYLNGFLRETQKLAKLERVNEDELLLLKTAALCYSLGYTYKYQYPGRAGTNIAKNSLPISGYTSDQINKISEILLGMEKPKTKLQKILRDADTFYFFGDNSSEKLELLAQEFEKKGYTPIGNEEKKNNKYFTRTARRLRNEGKKNNINKLNNLLENNNL